MNKIRKFITYVLVIVLLITSTGVPSIPVKAADTHVSKSNVIANNNQIYIHNKETKQVYVVGQGTIMYRQEQSVSVNTPSAHGDVLVRKMVNTTNPLFFHDDVVIASDSVVTTDSMTQGYVSGLPFFYNNNMTTSTQPLYEPEMWASDYYIPGSSKGTYQYTMDTDSSVRFFSGTATVPEGAWSGVLQRVYIKNGTLREDYVNLELPSTTTIKDDYADLANYNIASSGVIKTESPVVAMGGNEDTGSIILLSDGTLNKVRYSTNETAELEYRHYLQGSPFCDKHVPSVAAPLWNEAYPDSSKFKFIVEDFLLSEDDLLYQITVDHNDQLRIQGPLSPTPFETISKWHDHVLALDMSGNIWSMGDNNFGECGNGTTTPVSTPVQITVGTQFESIAAGQDISCAVDLLGNVYTWGNNNEGYLGFMDWSTNEPIADILTPTFLFNINEVPDYDSTSYVVTKEPTISENGILEATCKRTNAVRQIILKSKGDAAISMPGKPLDNASIIGDNSEDGKVVYKDVSGNTVSENEIMYNIAFFNYDYDTNEQDFVYMQSDRGDDKKETFSQLLDYSQDCILPDKGALDGTYAIQIYGTDTVIPYTVSTNHYVDEAGVIYHPGDTVSKLTTTEGSTVYLKVIYDRTFGAMPTTVSYKGVQREVASYKYYKSELDIARNNYLQYAPTNMTAIETVIAVPTFVSQPDLVREDLSKVNRPVSKLLKRLHMQHSMDDIFYDIPSMESYIRSYFPMDQNPSLDDLSYQTVKQTLYVREYENAFSDVYNVNTYANSTVNSVYRTRNLYGVTRVTVWGKDKDGNSEAIECILMLAPPPELLDGQHKIFHKDFDYSNTYAYIDIMDIDDFPNYTLMDTLNNTESTADTLSSLPRYVKQGDLILVDWTFDRAGRRSVYKWDGSEIARNSPFYDYDKGSTKWSLEDIPTSTLYSQWVPYRETGDVRFYPVDTVTENTVFRSEDVVILGNVENETLTKIFGKSSTITQTLMQSTNDELDKLLNKFSKSSRELNLDEDISKTNFVYTDDKILVSDGWSSVNLGGEIYQKQESLNSVEVANPKYEELNIPEEGTILEPFPNTAAELDASWYEDNYYVVKTPSAYYLDSIMGELVTKVAYYGMDNYDATFLNLPSGSIYDTGYAFTTSMNDPIQKIYLHKYMDFTEDEVWSTDFADSTAILNHIVDINGNPLTIPIDSGMYFRNTDGYYDKDSFTNPVLFAKDVKIWLETTSRYAQVEPFDYSDWSFNQGAQIGDRQPTPFVGTNAAGEYVDVYYEKRLDYWSDDYSHFALVASDGYEFRWVDTFMRKSYVSNPYDYVYKDVVQVNTTPLNNDELFNAIRYGSNTIASEIDALPLGSLYELPYIWYSQPGDVPQKIFIKQTWNDGTTVGSPFDDFAYTNWEGLFFTEDGTAITGDYYQDIDGNWHDYEYYEVSESGNTVLPTVRGDLCVKDGRVYVDAEGTAVDITSLSYNGTTTYGEALTRCEDIFNVDLLDVKTVAKTVSGDTILLNEYKEPSVHTPAGLNSLYRNQLSQYANGYLNDATLLETAILYAVVDGQDLIEMLQSETFYIVKFPSERDMKIVRSYIKDYVVSKVSRTLLGDYELKLDALSLRLEEGADKAYEYRSVTVSADSLAIPEYSEWHLKYDKDSTTKQEFENFLCRRSVFEPLISYAFNARDTIDDPTYRNVVLPIIEDDMSQTLHLDVDSYQTIPGSSVQKPKVYKIDPNGVRTNISSKAATTITQTDMNVNHVPLDGKRAIKVYEHENDLNIITEDNEWWSTSLTTTIDDWYNEEYGRKLSKVDVPVGVKELWNTTGVYSYTGRVPYFLDVDGNLWSSRRSHDGIHFENDIKSFTQVSKGVTFTAFGDTEYKDDVLLLDADGNIWAGRQSDYSGDSTPAGFFSKYAGYLGIGVPELDADGNPIQIKAGSFILRRLTKGTKFVDVSYTNTNRTLYALDDKGNLYAQGNYVAMLGQYHAGNNMLPGQSWYYRDDSQFENGVILQLSKIDDLYPRLKGMKWKSLRKSGPYMMFIDTKDRLWEQLDGLVGYQITEMNVLDATHSYVLTKDGIMHSKVLRGKNAARDPGNNLFQGLRFKSIEKSSNVATLVSGDVVVLPNLLANEYAMDMWDVRASGNGSASYWSNLLEGSLYGHYNDENGWSRLSQPIPEYWYFHFDPRRKDSVGEANPNDLTQQEINSFYQNLKVLHLNDLQQARFEITIDFNDLFYIDGIPFDKGDYIEIESEYGTMIHKIVGAEMKTIGMYSEMLSENNVPVTKEIDGVEITTNQLKIDRVTSDMDQAIMYSKSVYTAEPNPYYSRRITLDVVEIESLEAEYIGDDVIVGTEIPTSDIELTARYEDGHEINLLYSELTDAPQTMSIQSLGANMFTFEYEEVADDVVINGIAPPPGLSVVSVSGNIPDSTFVGTDFDETKAEIEVTYNDGTVQSISYNDLDIPVADQEVTNVGTNTYPIVVNSVSGNLTVQGYYYGSISANYVGPAIVAPDSYSKSDVEVSLSYTPNNVGAVTRVLNDSEWLASSLNIPSVGWHAFTATLVDDVSYTADYSILGIKQPQSLTATYTGIPLLKGTTYSKDDVQVDVVYTDATTETLSSNNWIASSLIVTNVGVNTYSASYGTLSANYVITGFNNMNHITAQYTGQPVSVGQDYSKDDVLVTLFYDNNETETISSNGWSASGTTITATGNNTFTATYLSMTADYTVPGLRVPVSITAEYDGPDIVLGRQYSKDDVDVTVTYNDTTQELLSSSAWTPSSLVVTNVSSNSFTATYGSLTAQYTVNGYNNVESISANYVGEPVLVGTNHNKGDVTVVAVYSNGSTTPISGNDWTASSLLVTRRGANSFTATYQTFSDTYSVPGEIEIKGLSAKYNGPQIHVGSDYVKANVTVTVTFTDSSTRVLSASEWVASGVRVDRVGTNTYTATYRGQRATYDVMGFQNVIQKVPNIVTKALKTGDNSIVVISLLLLGLLLIVTSLRKERI